MSSVPEYSKCFIRLQHLWKGRTKKEFQKYMQEKLSSSADPYRMALVSVKLCPDLFKCKQDSLVANILVELQTFMSQEDNGQKFEACLTEELQGEVYNVAIRQKNTGVLKLLVRVFQIRKRGEKYLPSLKTLLQQGQYKEVCVFASLLGLESQFTTEELIIPLFLEDRLSLADALLESSPPHQKELILLIDDIIGNKITMTDLQKYKIKDPKKIRSSKILCGVLAKLLKKFDLPPTLCPHFQKFRATGGLRFLFFKYYIEKTLQKSTFYSLIDDALKETPSIQIELLNLFVDYCDAPGALPYVTTLQLSPADIPVQVQEAMHQYPHLLQQGRNMEEDRREEEESWDEEIGNYFALDIPIEKIIFVDSVPLFTKCIESINQSSLLGIDSEWKPSFGIGGTEQAALLQFATTNDVFVLDLLSLQPVLQPSHWESIGQLFANPAIAKLGYGIKGDFRILGGLHGEIKKGIMAATNVIDFDLTKNILVEEQPNIFSHSGENHKGLSDLIYRCFGLSLDKRECFSNWAARPLTTSQLFYAALDARCLINTYCYLDQKASQLQLPDWRKIQRKPGPTEKKAKGKTPDKSKTLNTDKRQMTPSTQQRKPVKAADFKVVCDTMVQGLARQLRSCGVDAVALDSGEESERCITYHLREGRVVLSRGRSYQSLTKHIHPQHIYNVSGSTAQDQLAEVISEFRVKVTLGDVFARCRHCNSHTFLALPSATLATLQGGLRGGGVKRGERVGIEGGSREEHVWIEGGERVSSERERGEIGEKENFVECKEVRIDHKTLEEEKVTHKDQKQDLKQKPNESQEEGLTCEDGKVCKNENTAAAEVICENKNKFRHTNLDKGMDCEGRKACKNDKIEGDKIRKIDQKLPLVECDGGRVDISTGKTDKGVLILANAVPKTVLASNEMFYACAGCGKCYWEGSHHRKVLDGRLKGIVDLDDESDGGIEFVEE